jgi:integrase
MSVRKRTWTTRRGERRAAWLVDYVDQEGDRHIETFSKKKDADAYHASVRVDVAKGVHTPASKSITVSEAANDWIARVEGDGREPTTVTQYRQHVNLHIVPRIGNVKLAALTTPSVEKFRDDLVRDLSRSMARKVLGSLKSLLKDAKRRGNVAQNVAADTTVKAMARSRRKLQAGVDFPLPAEVRSMLGVVSGRARALLLVAAFAGLRGSELRGLLRKDVDLKRAEIHVRQRADRFGTIGDPKSEAGERTIPVMPMVINALRELELQATGTYVFGNGAGNVESHSNLVQRVLQRAQIAADITVPVLDDKGEQKFDGDGKPIAKAKYTGLHSLRHFFAAWALTRPDHGGLGLTLKELQERLGHSTLAMTADTYGHLLPAHDDVTRTAPEAAERAMFGAA